MDTLKLTAKTINLEKKEETVLLYSVEFVEFLVPLVYTITFLMAYYGPNSEIMGGIGSDYWCSKKITDIEQTLSRLGICFVIDAMRGIFIGLALWKYCKINIYKTYCQVMEQFGVLIFLLLAMILNKVCILSSVLVVSCLIRGIYTRVLY